MPVERRIRVMISSKNKDNIPGFNDEPVPLSDVRKKLKEELESTGLFGKELFKVWINEDAGAQAGTGDAWDECMLQVDSCDIFVMIYNGDAGWSNGEGDLGICHAEFERAWSRAPAKVYSILLDFQTDGNRGLTNPEEVAKKGEENRRFKAALDRVDPFRDKAKDAAELLNLAEKTVVRAVKEMTIAGAAEARRGKFYLGTPLEWSRLSYAQRKDKIEQTMHSYLESSKGAKPEDDGHIIQLGQGEVYVISHGVPSSFSVPEARELVGRPFLKDHESPPAMANSGLLGPVHLIGCHKLVTEAQITRFLGHPDIYIVETPFGYFVADQVTFAQVLFLKNCRDESSTRLALQRAFRWTDQAQEVERILDRAKSRATILRAISKEIRP